MLFNSLEFLIFLAIVFLIYWKLDRKGQNIFIVIVSYIFYGWWDWRFLFLIFASSIIDFFIGKKIDQTEEPKKRKLFLILSIAVNLGILGFFKYFGFFVHSLQDLLLSFGLPEISITTLNIILPVGISFYTFQELSYTIEVYQKKIPATKNLIEFMDFVTFFPQLVAGPIERASNLLGQFAKERLFNLSEAIDGCKQMLWGFFKKIVIADSLAGMINSIYSNVDGSSGSKLFFATFFFAFQIYCDFSGYSDIAIGTAKLFGFKIMRNFAYPYFSRNIAEFWRRWHISLSNWFRDYVFIPLGGSRTATKFKYLTNILLTFTLSGLWHGANWTYIVWGFLNGLYYLPSVYLPKFKNHYKNDSVASLKELPSVIITFVFVLFGWIFFRASSMSQAFLIIYKIGLAVNNFSVNPSYLKRIGLIAVLIIVEWWQRKQPYPIKLEGFSVWLKRLVYYGLVIIILLFGTYKYTPFIYFQF